MMNIEQPSSELRQMSAALLPTRFGLFRALGFERVVYAGSRTETAVALIMGELGGTPPLTRIHSQCITGEVFGSLRCDCRMQFEQAMYRISEEGRGMVIYEYQEGRGIGLLSKLRAYALQDQGLDTVEANEHLGFEVDLRDYALPIEILKRLSIPVVRLMSNNPEKWKALNSSGIKVAQVIPCEVPPSPHSKEYLLAKKQKLGHVLRLV